MLLLKVDTKFIGNTSEKLSLTSAIIDALQENITIQVIRDPLIFLFYLLPEEWGEVAIAGWGAKKP